MRVRSITILMLVLALLNSAAAQSVHDQLESNWDLQRTILQSVVVRCRTVTRISTQTLSPDEVHKLLANDVSADDEALRDLVHKLDPTLKTVDNPWSVGEYVFDADSVREDLDFDGRTRSHVWHRDLQITKDPHNNQVNLQTRPRSSLRIPRLEDFVFLPPPGVIRITDSDSKDGKLILSKGNTRLIVDENTGFVEKFRRGKYPGRFEEVLQYGVTVHGDVAVPTWRFSGEYSTNGLRMFTLRIIEDIDLSAVREEQFTVSAEPNTVIVDRREEKKVPVRVKVPIYDVQSFDPESFLKAQPKRSELRGSNTSWFMYLNVAVILGELLSIVVF